MTVEWHEIALDILADLVVTADLTAQDAIAQDVEWINRQLSRNPHSLGESRGRKHPDMVLDPCGCRLPDRRRYGLRSGLPCGRAALNRPARRR